MSQYSAIAASVTPGGLKMYERGTLWVTVGNGDKIRMTFYEGGDVIKRFTVVDEADVWPIVQDFCLYGELPL